MANTKTAAAEPAAIAAALEFDVDGVVAELKGQGVTQADPAAEKKATNLVGAYTRRPQLQKLTAALTSLVVSKLDKQPPKKK